MKTIPNLPTDTEVVMRYLLGLDSTNLTATQKLILKRAQGCKDLVYEYGPDKAKVIRLHARLQQISEETAMQDYQNMLFFFNVQKESPRNFWIDFAISSITKNIAEARAAKDFMAVSRENKNMLQLIEKFFGQEEKPDYSKLQPLNIIMGFFPEMTGVELPASKKELQAVIRNLEMIKKKDFNWDDLATDAEIEE